MTDEWAEDTTISMWCGPIEEPTRYIIRSLRPVVRHGQGDVYEAVTSDGQRVALKHLPDATTVDLVSVLRRHKAIANIGAHGLVAALECFAGTFTFPRSDSTVDEEPLVDDDFEDVIVVTPWVGVADLDVEDSSLAHTTDVIRQVAALLASLHSARPESFAHFDVKPTNIRVGSQGQAYLIDFESTRPADGATRSAPIGVRRYMAPEQQRPGAPASVQADIYPLGVMLLEALTGGADVGSIDRDELAISARAAGLADPSGLADLVVSCVSDDPEQRPSASDVENRLATVLSRRRRRPLRRTRRRVTAAALMAIAAVALIGPRLSSGPDSHPSITVQNLVTNGDVMREDTSFVRLTTVPRLRCPTSACVIDGTSRSSNETYDRAICIAQGDRITNGEDNSPVDDDNPLLFESTNWYGVETTSSSGDTVRGFVSWTWITPDDRNRDLPTCEDAEFEPSVGVSS